MLAYVLRTYPPAKKAFLKLTLGKDYPKIKNIDTLKIDTQYPAEYDNKQKYIDIAIYDDENMIFIENKIGSEVNYDEGSDKSQLLQYMNILNDYSVDSSNISKLILLARSNPFKLDELKQELSTIQGDKKAKTAAEGISEILSRERKQNKQIFDKYFTRKDSGSDAFFSWDEVSDCLLKAFDASRNKDNLEGKLFKKFVDFMWEEKIMGEQFRGIQPFGPENPFSIEKARRLSQKLFDKKGKVFEKMKAQYADVCKEFGRELDLRFDNKLNTSVAWGNLFLKNEDEEYNKWPHFCFGLDPNNFWLGIILPNADKSNSRNNLSNILQKDKNLLLELRKRVPVLNFSCEQVHDRGGINLVSDGTVTFKFEHLLDKDQISDFENKHFRPLMGWCDFFINLLTNKNTNIQFIIYANFPLDKNCSDFKNLQFNRFFKYEEKNWACGEKFPETISNVLEAFKPLYKELIS